MLTDNPIISAVDINGLSVDFGGSKILAARVIEGCVDQYLQVATQGDAPIEQQISVIIQLLEKLSLTGDDKVAIAVAGRVTAQGNWLAVNAQTLSQVDCIPIGDILQQRLQRKIAVKNDALAALLGESVLGAAKADARCAYITVSTGVGGAIILNGVPVTSDSGIAGHIGFTTSRYASTQCGSGRFGTVESIASGRAITATAKALGHNITDAKQVFNAHINHQLWATEIIQTSAAAIAELCANLQSIFGLDIIVIGGGIGLAPGYLALVQQSLAREPDIFQVKLVRAQLGQYSAIYGNLLESNH